MDERYGPPAPWSTTPTTSGPDKLRQNTNDHRESAVKICAFLACANARLRQGVADMLTATQDIEIVGEAGDGWQAVEGVEMVCPDVLLMDIDLPGLSEPQATGEIAHACPGLSILVLTTFARQDLMAYFDDVERGGNRPAGEPLGDLLVAIRTLGSGEVLIYPPW